MIYVGLVDLTCLSQQLREHFSEAESEETRERDPSGECAILCLQADGDGRLEDEFFVSSLPWAMGKITNSQGTDFELSGFEGEEGYEGQLKRILAERFSQHVEPGSDCVTVECDSNTTSKSEAGMRCQRPAPATFRLLIDCLLAVFDLAKWGQNNVAAKRTIRIKASKTTSENRSPATDMLNSFFSAELIEVQQNLKNLPIALRKYLGTERVDRIDVVRNAASVDRVVLPKNFPKARWPSKSAMVLAQQFAVNKAMELLAEGHGLYSINGPPGTGKTTLLRELIAAILCKRADALIRLSNPRQAFESGPDVINKRGFEAHVHRLKRQTGIGGHGIVVASGNNGAVQNVSQELPTLKTISAENFETPAYFRKVAETLAEPSENRSIKRGQRVVGTTWGLISAVLGNSENRKKFADRFWFADSDPSSFAKDIPVDELVTTFRTELAEKNSKSTDWDKARRNYQLAVAKVEERTNLINRFAESWQKQSAAKKEVVRLEAEVTRIAHEHSQCLVYHDACERAVKAKAKELEDLQKIKSALGRVAESKELCASFERRLYPNTAIAWDPDIAASKSGQIHQELGDRTSSQAKLQRRKDEHILIKPGFLIRLLRPGTEREWSSGMKRLTDECNANEERIGELNRYHGVLKDYLDNHEVLESLSMLRNGVIPRDINGTITESDSALGSLKEDFARIQKTERSLSAKLERAEAALAKARANLESIDDHVASAPADLRENAGRMYGDDREKTPPWYDEELQRRRAECFSATLALQEAFIVANHNRFKENLDLWIDVYSGGLSRNQFGSALEDLWETLFLAVPVVSTAFASIGRMFSGLGPGSIGWLFVDEAGQSTPQMAVGALWRSQRAIIVGDPLQLEPIMPLPASILETLADIHEVSAPWYEPINSVQRVADSANHIGTYIANEQTPVSGGAKADGSSTNEESLWVGSPLRVHRRCQRPMFEIANQIAYGELMVYDTIEERNAAEQLPANAWIDLPSANPIEHWIPDHGAVAIELLKHLLKHFRGGKACEGENRVFVLSPFKSVAEHFRNSVKDIANFRPDDMVGTVHTFQGKEADAVILLLGCNPQRSGAIPFFAAAKPNLLNVAVTRAKHRLYVIGDRALWARAQYFRVLDKKIRTVDSSELLSQFVDGTNDTEADVFAAGTNHYGRTGVRPANR
jgi:hypothetical protein